MYDLIMLSYNDFSALFYQVHSQADEDTRVDCTDYKLMDPFEKMPGTFLRMYLDVSWERTLEVWYCQERHELFFTSNNELRLHVVEVGNEDNGRVTKVNKIITLAGERI